MTTLTRDELLHIITKDGIDALKADQRMSTLSQIEALANTRFGSVSDLYVFLRDQRIWPFKVKADSIYKSLRQEKFKGRDWYVLTPTFNDLTGMQTVRIQDGTTTVGLLIGVARAEKTLAARISKEKSRLQEAFDFISGYKNYNPEPPSQPAPKTQVEDVIDADFVEVPETPKPALPAPSETPETPKPAKPETPKPASEAKPLHLEVGVINSDRSALEAILSALVKTKSNSNKTELLAFRSEVRQALVSAGLLEDK